jgi:hypothetical protein
MLNCSMQFVRCEFLRHLKQQNLNVHDVWAVFLACLAFKEEIGILTGC